MSIKSREDWEEAKKRANGGANKLLALKKNPNSNSLSFGEGFKYRANLTLGEWAKQNGINLH
jgi:hypothetical protein